MLCETGGVQGTRYVSDYDTEYSIHLYVFYEEFGYIIDFCGMQELGQEKLISLAKKISVTETDKKNASDYIYLSKYHIGAMGKNTEPVEKTEVKNPVRAIGDLVKHDGMTYQVTDVEVNSRVEDTSKRKFRDGDMTDKMYLCIDNNMSIDNERQYIAISK